MQQADMRLLVIHLKPVTSLVGSLVDIYNTLQHATPVQFLAVWDVGRENSWPTFPAQLLATPSL